MKPYLHTPGVPAAGHIARGFWHPGRIDGCVKCEPPKPRCRDCGRPPARNAPDAMCRCCVYCTHDPGRPAHR